MINAGILAAILAACHLHPTPPPQAYVDRAVAALPYVDVVLALAPDAKAACAAVGIPHAGACAWITTTVNIIVPEDRWAAAACHEIAHYPGGWPGNHSRRVQ